MKKQTAAVVSFSALLTLSAFAPSFLLQEKHNVNRFPASEEAITPPKKSLYEMREMDKHLQDKIEVKKEEAQVSCLKDKQPSALEDEIKKLMADKEAIVKEIDELKKSKKEEPKENDKKEVAKADKKDDYVSLISQMTSLMITQQEQQMMLMQQMFSMMNQMQTPQMKYQQYNPYSFGVDQFDAFSFSNYYPQAQPSSEFGPRFAQLGQNLSQAQPAMNPYLQQRAPAQYEAPYSFNLGGMMNIQPAVQMENPVNPSSDFVVNNNVMDMQRVMFE